MKTNTYLFKNIKWDTDGISPKALKLPNQVKYSTDNPDFDPLEDGADALSDNFGYCVFSFEVDNDKQKKQDAIADKAFIKGQKAFLSRRELEKKAEKQFVKQLNKAINLAYDAGIENRGDILTLPIKDLYFSLTNKTK